MKSLVGTIGDSGGWQPVTLNLANFALGPEGTGNGVFAWDKVMQMEFAFDKSDGGSGTLAVDEIYLSVANLLWDDFESGSTTNLFGGTIGTWTAPATPGIVSAVNVSTVSYRGTHSLQINYDISAGPASMWITGNKKNVTGMDRLTFKVRGAVGNENVLLILKDTPTSTICQDYINISTFTGISQVKTDWQQVTIDLSQYQSKLSQIESLNIEMPSSLSGKTGTIYIDDLYFYNSKTGQSLSLLDNMDTPVGNTSWQSYADATSVSKLTSVTGYLKGAIQMDYTFNSGAWLNMVRKAAINMSYCDAIYIPMKMTGDANNIEVKLQDSSGTTYYRKRPTAAQGWGTLKAPIKDFIFFQGQAGSNLNLREITAVWVTVSRYSTGKTGSVYMGAIIAGSEASFFNDFSATAVMTRIDVANNPFRVDGTAFNNAAIFKFNLSEPASLRFRLYNLKGIIIYDFQTDYQAGDNSFQWDGRNNSGTLQNSGLYIYQIYVKGATTGRDQKFNNIVGIGK
jgi:hypothetical protein